LAPLEGAGKLRRPIIPKDCRHNAHMYYMLLESLEKRTEVIAKLKEQNVHAVFHYVPLHNSPAGKKYGRANGELRQTGNLADRLLRLPLWVGMDEAQDKVIAQLHAII